MPPRLSKRQLREQEELEALDNIPATPEDGEVEESEEEPRGTASGFAALLEPESEEETSRQSKAKKKKKKKKGAEGASPAPVVQAPATTQKPLSTESGNSKKEKKALKKQKAKAQKDDRDEIEKALEELSLKHPELKQVSQNAVSTQSSNEFTSLLQVSLSHLDSEAEMRKFFGSRVISASKASSSGQSSAAAARRQHAGARSHLTRPQATWWPATYRQGLSIRALNEEEVEDMNERHGWEGVNSIGERVWTVEYSKKYKGVTKAFIQMVMSGDPEGLFQMLRNFPYHADTLLQLSEVYYHREEHSTAADFINRAIFTYERAFVGAFNFTSGLNRLDFDRVENRPLFLAIHRQVSDLQRRGCFRTAFEFARLLLGLDPSSDPHGALLHLDFLALKANMSHWLLSIWDAQYKLSQGHWKRRMDVRALPGWAYSRALALFIQEEAKGNTDHKQSTSALSEAINAFPSIVPLLADRADISLSAEVRSNSVFKIHTDSSTLNKQSDCILHLLSHLYALRSHSLWKPKERAAWFTHTVSSISASIPPSYDKISPSTHSSPSPSLFHTNFTLPMLAYSVYRHVVVLESFTRAGRLFGFLPQSVTSGGQLACDPLPPPIRLSEYNEDFFRGAEDPFSLPSGGRRQNQRMLERLIPDPVFRRQLQDFFNANPQVAQRFPGGIMQFAQFAAQMPEDVLEDLMIAEAAGGGQGDGGMPGGMPDEEFGIGLDDANEDDEGNQDDDDLDIAPLPVRIIRNVMNRFWGGGANVEEESSSDEVDARPQMPDDTVD